MLVLVVPRLVSSPAAPFVAVRSSLVDLQLLILNLVLLLGEGVGIVDLDGWGRALVFLDVLAFVLLARLVGALLAPAKHAGFAPALERVVRNVVEFLLARAW